ncbi:MAG: hypothetical protein WBF28_06540, partial [Atribacterota bacterium]
IVAPQSAHTINAWDKTIMIFLRIDVFIIFTSLIRSKPTFLFRLKRGSGLEMTHFFNNKKVLMENVLFQDLTPYLLPCNNKIKDILYLQYDKPL